MDASLRYGGALERAGVRKGEVVLIFLPTSEACVGVFLGGMLVGAIPSLMPLPSEKQDPDVYWASHAALFRHVGEGWIVAPREFVDAIRECSGGSLNVLPLDALDLQEPASIATVQPSDVAFLQHSSGTTGLKKGVPVSHRQLADQLEAYAGAIDLNEKSVIVSWLPLYHDMGLIACFLLPVFTGCKLVVIDPFRWTARPRILFEEIDRQGGTHCWMPNFAFSHMANIAASVPARFSLRSMKKFINCSEHCKPGSFDRFVEAFAHLGVVDEMMTCCYAMAETVFAVTQTGPGPCARERNTLSSGRVIEGMSIRIMGDDGREVTEDGEIGEIQISSAFLFDGYYKNPDRTKESFEGGWYKTRDYGFLKNGELFVQGRLDDMIIVNGRNLYAHEVESELSSIPGVIAGRSVAFSIENEAASTDGLIVVCETMIEDPLSLDDLKQRISDHVFAVIAVMPREILLVPPRSILKTSSGKTDRKRNKQKHAEGKFSNWSMA